MTTSIHKKVEVKEPIEKVWAYLTNPEKIVVCVPGAFLSEKIDDRNFKGGVTLKFGPVKAKYNGQVTFEELDEVNRKMTLKGKGMDAKGKGSADMLMESQLNEIAGGTEIDCTMQLSIVGKLAQFGARLINDVSDQIFDQFINNFKETLAADSNEAPVASSTEKEEVSTQAKAAAVSESAAAVEKAVEDVKKAQEALERKLTDKEIEPTFSQNGTSQQSYNSTKTKQKKTDNSLNTFSLMISLIKGWISRLFGGGK